MRFTEQTLRKWHREFNDDVFSGQLSAWPVTCSRLPEDVGGYCYDDCLIEIADSHETRKDAWLTLLHEMIHQWQVEVGQPMNHGPSFERWRNQLKEHHGLVIP